MLEVVTPIVGARLLKHLGVFQENQERVLINYVLYFSLPILAFEAGYSIKNTANILKISAVAWACILVSMLCAYFLSKLLKLDVKSKKTFLLISSFGNTAFLGYPYAYSYFGQEGLQIAIIYDNIGSFLLVSSLGILIASGKPNLKEVIFFPPFLGLILGFVSKGLALNTKVLSLLGSSTLPVVLFALGLSLNLGGIKKNIRVSLIAIFVKVFVGLFVSLLVGKILNLPEVELKVSILESAMPPMMFSAVLAMKYNLNPSLAFASVGLGIILSFFYVPVLIKFLS